MKRRTRTLFKIGIPTAILLLVLFGLLIGNFGSTGYTVLSDTTTVPCTYSGCENEVQCPSGFIKAGCVVANDGYCTCYKPVSCQVEQDCYNYAQGRQLCPIGQNLKFTCQMDYGLQYKYCDYICETPSAPPSNTSLCEEFGYNTTCPEGYTCQSVYLSSVNTNCCICLDSSGGSDGSDDSSNGFSIILVIGGVILIAVLTFILIKRGKRR